MRYLYRLHNLSHQHTLSGGWTSPPDIDPICEAWKWSKEDVILAEYERGLMIWANEQNKWLYLDIECNDYFDIVDLKQFTRNHMDGSKFVNHW